MTLLIWYVVRDLSPGAFPEVRGGMSLHVRTFTLLFYTSATAEPINLTLI